MPSNVIKREVIVIGGGLAGLSAAVYLGRSKRQVLMIDSGHSMATWEPHVQNYLGFSKSISGEELLKEGRAQAVRYGVEFAEDEITTARREDTGLQLNGNAERYSAKRLLLATGITHVPPEIPHTRACLGRSLFFCKDCDAYRIQGHRIGIIGQNNEAVEYALALLAYTDGVMVITNGGRKLWDERHAAWLQEYHIPIYGGQIVEVEHQAGQITAIGFDDGARLPVDDLFATRGDVCHNKLAHDLGADCDAAGQIKVDANMQTSVPGVYAAGCVTPSNCQMIIAAGEGAAAAQAINQDLFYESLQTGSLRRYRAT